MIERQRQPRFRIRGRVRSALHALTAARRLRVPLLLDPRDEWTLTPLFRSRMRKGPADRR